jgi:hypothetical protein
MGQAYEPRFFLRVARCDADGAIILKAGKPIPSRAYALDDVSGVGVVLRYAARVRYALPSIQSGGNDQSLTSRSVRCAASVWMRV